MEASTGKRPDLTGQRFGSLTVLSPAGKNRNGRTMWLCRCDCGTERAFAAVYLRNGHTRSCGCMPKVHYVDGTCVEMLRNNPLRSNNTSGVTGVFWSKEKRRWRAQLHFKGHKYALGYFARFEDAVKARKDAEEKYHAAFLAEIDGQ